MQARRFWIFLSFLLLGIAQHGAAFHSVSHAFSSPDQSPPFECDQCVAYAGVTSGANTGHHFLEPRDALLHFASTADGSYHPVTVLAFSSRAPPFLR
jgi:hypothetical protein